MSDEESGAESTVAVEQSTILNGHVSDPDDNDFATPRRVWKPLADAVDGFDLDAAAGAEPVPIADERLTKPDDGLTTPWHGNVWLNPPWSSDGSGSAKETWLQRAREQAARDAVEVVVMLLPAATDAHWFHDHVLAADAVCLMGPGRVEFVGEDRNPSFGTVLFAFGAVDGDLLDAMDQLGAVLVDGARHDPAPQATLGGVLD